MNYKTVYNITSREEACRYLGVAINATWSDIKNAYRDLSKRYHPDVNSNPLANEYYVLVNNAYRYLENNPYIEPVVRPRQAKVFQTVSSVRQDYAKQKSMQEERKKVKAWEAKKKQQEFIEKEELKRKQIAKPNAAAAPIKESVAKRLTTTVSKNNTDTAMKASIMDTPKQTAIDSLLDCSSLRCISILISGGSFALNKFFILHLPKRLFTN